MDILKAFADAIKGKIIPVLTVWRRWSKPGYIRAQLLAKIGGFFTALLDVRPRSGKDYYTVGRWLVSRRLALAVLVGAGMLSAYYVLEENGAWRSSTDGAFVKTYSYDNLLLRFTEGEVRILGKSGYPAYEGQVRAGKANGMGSLFTPGGALVYRGEFADSRYQGEGTAYYENGRVKYRGGFADNLYEGQGSLFRENGSLLYEGAFSRGRREGAGSLYDAGGAPVYQGNFSRDLLLYSELPGKSTEELAAKYSGRQTIYTDEDYFAVYLQELGAVCYGRGHSELLDDSITVDGVYVLQDYFYEQENRLETVTQLAQFLAPLSYEGNSMLTMPEAVAVRKLGAKGRQKYADTAMQTEAVFEDVLRVISYDMDTVIYLHSYEKDGLRYTFFGRDRYGAFDFYGIESMAE